MSPRARYPRLNKYADVKHLTGDYRVRGISDAEVYRRACLEGRILVTLNKKDFQTMLTPTSSTIIAVTAGITEATIDGQITKLVKEMTATDQVGELFVINSNNKQTKTRKPKQD